MVGSSLKCNFLSAKGADWKSQGQVLSIAKHVAPGRASELGHYPTHLPGASRFAALSALPLAITFRAFGAQQQFHNFNSLHFQLESTNGK